MKRTVVLVVLDGWGVGSNDASNPIHTAEPETIKHLSENYPVTSLQASGIAVGLPWGSAGSSEVGHLTLGAGKVIYQHYPRISLTIRDGTFASNEALLSAISSAKDGNGRIHLAGLLSRGNVHASIEHLDALLSMCKAGGVEPVLHLFADGKDSEPKTLESHLSAIPKELIGTIIGRYYAMDREENWSLIEGAYKCMTGQGGAEIAPEALTDTVNAHYAKGMSEEFLPPIRIAGDGHAVTAGDSLIFFNFREDGIGELASAFIDKNFDKFPVIPVDKLHVVTMTRYKEGWDVPVAFPAEEVEQPLGKVIADAGKIQLRLAETRKDAHVTYFFNGYSREPFKNEYRVLIPSEQSAHPEKNPKLQAPVITERLLQAIGENSYDFILVNYANPDVMAHAGNFEAAEEAVRAIDAELARILPAVESSGAVLIMTSDHGNIERLRNPMTGRVETQHDPSPVPLWLIGKDYKGKKFRGAGNLSHPFGILADVAPTILELLEISKPAQMTGKSLLREIV